MTPLTERFSVFVPGRPVPQGSKTAFVSKSTGKPIVVDKDVRLPAWRMKITTYAREAMADRATLTGPVGIRVEFILDRPKWHMGTGKNADTVKPSSPSHPHSMPDLDKLLRAVFDGLTDAQVWADDGQVVWCLTYKVYAGMPPFPQTGVHITLGSMT